MNTMRRFGPGQKELKATVDTGVSKGSDPSSAIRQNSQLIEVLRKIPLFKGLGLLQFKEMLRICGRRNFKEGESVCRMGEESLEFFILLQGTLKVLLEDDKVIARIEPIGVVGEMGVFTGEKRSANIVAATPSLVLTIHRMEIMKLFRMDVDMGIRIHQNVIQELASKIRRDNTIIQQLRKLFQVQNENAAVADEDETPEVEKWSEPESEEG